MAATNLNTHFMNHESNNIYLFSFIELLFILMVLISRYDNNICTLSFRFWLITEYKEIVMLL